MLCVIMHQHCQDRSYWFCSTRLNPSRTWHIHAGTCEAVPSAATHAHVLILPPSWPICSEVLSLYLWSWRCHLTLNYVYGISFSPRKEFCSHPTLAVFCCLPGLLVFTEHWEIVHLATFQVSAISLIGLFFKLFYLLLYLHQHIFGLHIKSSQEHLKSTQDL